MSSQYSRWYTQASHRFMTSDGGYLYGGQSVDDRLDVIGNEAARRLKKPYFADKFKYFMKKGWYSLSSPIWTNFGTGRGLPISCFNSHFSDEIDSILCETHSEIAKMSQMGGGTSAYMGEIRPRGSLIQGGMNGKSSGSVHFAAHIQSLMQTCSQGNTRRGNCALWWDITHGDIMEVLRIKQEGHPIQHLSYGVCVPDAWLNDMIAGDKKKREVWAAVIEARKYTGYPYILFVDNANRARPQWYKDQGLTIKSSNLCAEVTPTSNELESFVCDLSSLNALYYDEWKDTDAVETMVYFLDAIMDEFIERAKSIKYMDRAVRYAERHRSLGIGVFGWHHYLQSKMIPFESMEAMRLNAELFKTIQRKSIAASEEMAKEYGEPEVTKGYGRRHALLQAVAPTTSSAFIIGQTSETVEPCLSNIEIKDLAKGKYTVYNPYMLKLLDDKGKNTSKVIDSILKSGGSVQHLEFLNEHEKMVFRTFPEISQQVVVNQAAQRQQFIDQGQSLNVFLRPEVPAKEINALLLSGWKSGVKTFYYNKALNAAQDFARSLNNTTDCNACGA